MFNGVPCRELGEEIVNIRVGTGASQRLYPIHKSILCKKVLFFKNMFCGNFLEANTKDATLPEDCPDAFEGFVSWVYTDNVQVPERVGLKSPCDILMNLYAFGEKIAASNFADKVMDILVAYLKGGDFLPDPSQIEVGYGITPENSKLRVFLSRTAMYVTLAFNDEQSNCPWNVALLHPVMQRNADIISDTFALMRGKSGKVAKDPRNAPSCDYHVHPPAEICPHSVQFLPATPPCTPPKRICKKRKR